MTRRYLLTVTDDNAVRLESWLGYTLQIAPSGLAAGAGISIEALTAAPDETSEEQQP